MQRTDGRLPRQIRPIEIIPHFVRTATGSCLISCGGTRVICTASVEEGVPPFLKGKGQGWLTAEYAMLPASTGSRKARDSIRPDGRGIEIRRLIGRALRPAIDLTRLGERTVTLDCDVLEADGGTRTASITGAWVALALALDKLVKAGTLPASPLTRQVAAVSCGIVHETPLCDLYYLEDKDAQVDMNVVMDDTGRLIEVQGTGEGRAYTRGEVNALLDLARGGISQLMAAQRAALGLSPRLVAATGNPHKLAEIQAILGDRFEVVSLAALGYDLDVAEDADTFEGNALLKAQAIYELTGCASVADDSGLAVDALGGAPGVYSARYAGTHGDDTANNALLLQRLAHVPAPRTAHFVSAIALVRSGKDPLVVRGECPGEVIFEYRGDGGFGYDPLFLTPSGLTFAQMDAQQKNAISHRANSLQKLLEALDHER